jgi:pimeloyl-ACP methyl ester carboxylesterase
MARRPGRIRSLLFGAAAVGFVLTSIISSVSAQNFKDRLPVIVIPGLSGSELVNSKTGEVVWFKPGRSKVDDIRMPIDGDIAGNKDDLVTRDIFRRMNLGFKKVDVYGGLVTTLNKKGYAIGDLDNPVAGGGENTVYVFPYDWRRDNVENARLLVRKIDSLKTKLNRPDLKFNLVGHSMGGIIARYAAMYGDADLNMGGGAMRPDWAGARDIDRVVLLGTPSEGSVLSLDTMLNGFAVGGMTINLPFILNPSKFDIFTLPSAYQLLPAAGTLSAYDENLKKIDVDLYDPDTWSKYGWGALEDDNFVLNYSAAERANAKRFFYSTLGRAKRLNEALTASSDNAPVAIDLIGAECKDTLDSVVIYQEQNKTWKTLFKPAMFTNLSGNRITAAQVKKVLMAPGDGVVSKRSLTASSSLRPGSTAMVCEGHNALPSNAAIQEKIYSILQK